MVNDEIKYQILQAFGLSPTQEQSHALDVFCQFLTDRSEQAVMVMRGSAGTGKTTMARNIAEKYGITYEQIHEFLVAP